VVQKSVTPHCKREKKTGGEPPSLGKSIIGKKKGVLRRENRREMTTVSPEGPVSCEKGGGKKRGARKKNPEVSEKLFY